MPSQEEQERFIQLFKHGDYQDVSKELQKKPSLIKSRDGPGLFENGKQTLYKFVYVYSFLYCCNH